MTRALTFLTLMVLFARCDRDPVAPTVVTKPTVRFTVENNGCKAPCEVSFTSTVENAASYLWEFGDGQTSTQTDPRHTYSNVGMYEVTLTANGSGGSSTTSQKVKINLYQKVWDKSYGENLTGLLQTMIATYDGGFLLASNTTMFDGGDNPWPNSDLRLIKVGPDGLSQWEKYLRSSADDGLQAVVATADGGYLLGGVSNSPASGDKSEDSKGDLDYWVIKVDSQGAKQWDKTLGGSRWDVLSAIVSTPDGGFLLGGYSESAASGDKSEGTKGYRDYWIVKIKADGSKQWDKTVGGSGQDELMSILTTPDGGYLLGGTSDSPASGDKSEGSKGSNDYWVIKIGADGSRQWDKTFGGSSNEWFSSIAATSDGGYLLGGSSSSNATGDKSENSYGIADYWVIKLDAKGVKRWDKTYGGDRDAWLASIIATSKESFLLAGSSLSGISVDKSGTGNFWVIKLQ